MVILLVLTAILITSVRARKQLRAMALQKADETAALAI